jgi:APA family basic amino acid/polyamine antiporter
MPPTSTPPPPADAQLERVMGVRALTASSFNMTVGSGIFLLPAGVAVLIGAAAPVAYIVCALAMTLVVLCFAEAGSRVSRTGGAYAYSTAAFGPYVGALTGVLLYAGSGMLASAAVMNAFTITLAVIAPALGAPVARVAVMATVYGALALLNIRGAKPGVRTVEFFSIAKLVPLFALAAFGLFAMHGENLRIPALPPAGDIARTCVLLIFAFLGFENALSPSGEVKDSHRTVPRAVLLALGLVTVLYLTLQMVAQGVLGPRLAQETAAPLAAVAGTVFGGVGSTIILLGTLVSTFGYLSGDVLTSPRTLFALAEDGVLPPWMASVHRTYRTPWVSILAHALLAFTLAASGTFTKLAIIANVAVLLMYGIVCVGVYALRRKNVRAGGDPFVVPGGPIVPALAVVVIAWLLSTAKRGEWIGTGGALLVATALYTISLLLRRRFRVA